MNDESTTEAGKAAKKRDKHVYKIDVNVPNGTAKIEVRAAGDGDLLALLPEIHKKLSALGVLAGG